MAVYRWTYAHRRWVLVAIAVAAATIVGVLVGVGAAVVLLVFLLIAAGFVWRAGYMSEVVSDWSRSRFDSEPEEGNANWMGSREDSQTKALNLAGTPRPYAPCRRR